MKQATIAIVLMVFAGSAAAGVRTPGEGDNQMVARLQAMVRQISQERDALKTETAKLQGEIQSLNKDKDALTSDLDKTHQRLTKKATEYDKLKHYQEMTYAKLEEVVAKYKVLKQEKNQLQQQYGDLSGQFQQTTQQLDLCGQHNHKLIVSAEELLNRYQNKGTFSSLLQSEPVLQFQSVEMENIVQQYEDKIREQKYADTRGMQQ